MANCFNCGRYLEGNEGVWDVRLNVTRCWLCEAVLKLENAMDALKNIDDKDLGELIDFLAETATELKKEAR